MAEIYIEKRDEEGDFAVRRRGSERASAIASTQAKAIKVAEKMFPGVKPDVERVRYTSKGKPDQWRKQ
jgi:hypothetical protein